MRCERLDVWKRSGRLSVEVYKAFGSSQDYGFKDQITRSLLSISSKIAEGVEQESDKDKARFINIAQGSSVELITQIYIGIEIAYIEKTTGMAWIKKINEILRMLNALRKSYAQRP